MSRLTSAQIITLGQYLEPDFNPASLTVSQLLGVLGYHNIKYPTPYSKPKLVQLFNEQITSKATSWKRERLKKQNSIPSDDGITDGLTGQPLSGPSQTSTARRSSRRLSRAPVEETPAVRPDPPKRRRSSAQPNLGVASHRVEPVEPILVEESEPEEDQLPTKKVGRNRKTIETAGQARRVSNTAADDSGWEDNNIFQSGAESSSPLRPSPRPRAARKSTVARKSRKSASAPPQFLPTSSPPQSPEPRAGRLPLQPKFSPDIPGTTPRLPHDPEAHKIFPVPGLVGQSPLRNSRTTQHEDDEEYDEAYASEEIVQHDQIEHRPTAPSVDESVDVEEPKESVMVPAQPLPAQHPSFWLRALVTMMGIFALALVADYKLESASIGYCEWGSHTNAALEAIRGRRNAIEACNRENRTHLFLPPIEINSSQDGEHTANGEPCPLPAILPLPRPDTCTPCPAHAVCKQYDVTCNTGFLLRSHPLLFFLPPPSLSGDRSSISFPVDLIWQTLSLTMDGLPGFGSVAFPPRCLEDPKRKRNIGVLGKAIEAMLGQERGKRVCSGRSAPFPKDEGGDARQWGLELKSLRDVMKRKTTPHLIPAFDDTFNEAIQQLIQWDGVIIGEDTNGTRYVAHKTPDLTWNCMVTVKVRQAWSEWRATVLAITVAILSGFIIRGRRIQQKAEGKRIAELVQIALDTLRNQELAHHTDPITAPQPYLSSIQLRDLILQDEHSIPTRRRLWDQVERVVEGNANVRANLEELQGGDEMRVWRWVGSSKRINNEPS
ncbi:Man1-Src1p-C-terminal domain-containing protein [Infundibulicybe gibba]|nr:Man1-Src1p-C-terminal domain-containing protein [Infundibulicybe gibba]